MDTDAIGADRSCGRLEGYGKSARTPFQQHGHSGDAQRCRPTGHTPRLSCEAVCHNIYEVIEFENLRKTLPQG